MAMLTVLVCAASSSFAQDRPVLYNEEEYGRPTDGTTLRVCIDQRDPAWQIDEAIAREVAGLLLLEPSIYYIGNYSVSSPFEDVYYHLRAHCRVYFGFRLIAGHYPEWVSLTRPYYDAAYIFVSKDPQIDRLSDLPPGAPIAVTAGSTADFHFIRYNNSLPSANRWRRIPFGTDGQALSALDRGIVNAALIWGPVLLEHQDSGSLDLTMVDSNPLHFEPMPVGGLLLSTDSYLRQQLDSAISALTMSGATEELLALHAFLSVPRGQQGL